MNNLKTAILLWLCLYFEMVSSNALLLMNYSAITHSHNISLHIYSYIKTSTCWWTALWPKLHYNCYSMQLFSITQPLVLIIYAKCWRIKKPWSSSGRLPGALSSAHDLRINTGWQKEDLSLPEFLPVSLELSSICLKCLHETTRRCQHSRLLLPLF